MRRTCTYCGDEFTPPPGSTRKTCSHICKSRQMRKTMRSRGDTSHPTNVTRKRPPWEQGK